VPRERRQLLGQNPFAGTVGVRSTVAYSSMDKAVQQELGRVLVAADPSALSKLSTDDFVTAIGSIYSQVDYIHPFSRWQ
jgi:cell filamentation protein